MLAYSRMGRTSVVYARCLVLRGHVRMFLWRKADVGDLAATFNLQLVGLVSL